MALHRNGRRFLRERGRKKVLEEEGAEEGFREREGDGRGFLRRGAEEGVEGDYVVKLTSDGIFLLL